MSKFFNETLKARSAALTSDGIAELLGSAGPAIDTNNSTREPANEAENGTVKPSAAPASDLKGLLSDENSRIRPCISNPLREKFKGSNSLEAVDESYRALRTRLMRIRAAQGIRSVIVTSAIQGEGKTLTSVNLAWCCARLHDLRVLLIDGDIRTSGLSRSLNLSSAPGLAEVLSGEFEPQTALSTTDNPNLHVMGSGLFTKSPAELFAGEGWQRFIHWCGKNYDLILIDAPPVLNLADVELMLASCDAALMVVRALYTKREILQKCATQFDTKKLCGVVYNGTEYSTYHHYYGSPKTQ